VTRHIVVVGDLMVDVVARLSASLARGSDTPARIERHGGGQGANVAAWLAACGVPVTFVGRAGDDALGRGPWRSSRRQASVRA
jgi:sugar/nucleoside kinase (ribokinase family)